MSVLLKTPLDPMLPTVLHRPLMKVELSHKSQKTFLELEEGITVAELDELLNSSIDNDIADEQGSGLQGSRSGEEQTSSQVSILNQEDNEPGHDAHPAHKYLTTYIQNGKKLSKISIIHPGKLLILSTTPETLSRLQELSSRWSSNHANHARFAVSLKSTAKQTGYARALKTLPGFADTSKASELLARLRDDHAIISIMKEREWRIGTLSELHPHTDSTILGFNRNRGVEIALRLRTDALDGFRAYDSIVVVLLHELSHMVWSEHDDRFHGLNRELNRIYKGLTKGYRPNMEEAKFDPSVRVLGGRVVEGEMREVMANAASKRIELSKEEMELMKACGRPRA